MEVPECGRHKHADGLPASSSHHQFSRFDLGAHFDAHIIPGSVPCVGDLHILRVSLELCEHRTAGGPAPHGSPADGKYMYGH